jgi:hypothetical protein
MSPRGGHNVLMAPPPSPVYHYYSYSEKLGRYTYCHIVSAFWYVQTTEYRAINDHGRSLCGNCKRTRRAR